MLTRWLEGATRQMEEGEQGQPAADQQQGEGQSAEQGQDQPAQEDLSAGEGQAESQDQTIQQSQVQGQAVEQMLSKGQGQPTQAKSEDHEQTVQGQVDTGQVEVEGQGQGQSTAQDQTEENKEKEDQIQEKFEGEGQLPQESELDLKKNEQKCADSQTLAEKLTPKTEQAVLEKCTISGDSKHTVPDCDENPNETSDPQPICSTQKDTGEVLDNSETDKDLNVQHEQTESQELPEIKGAENEMDTPAKVAICDEEICGSISQIGGASVEAVSASESEQARLDRLENLQSEVVSIKQTIEQEKLEPVISLHYRPEGTSMSTIKVDFTPVAGQAQIQGGGPAVPPPQVPATQNVPTQPQEQAESGATKQDEKNEIGCDSQTVKPDSDEESQNYSSRPDRLCTKSSSEVGGIAETQQVTKGAESDMELSPTVESHKSNIADGGQKAMSISSASDSDYVEVRKGSDSEHDMSVDSDRELKKGIEASCDSAKEGADSDVQAESERKEAVSPEAKQLESRKGQQAGEEKISIEVTPSSPVKENVDSDEEEEKAAEAGDVVESSVEGATTEAGASGGGGPRRLPQPPRSGKLHLTDSLERNSS